MRPSRRGQRRPASTARATDRQAQGDKPRSANEKGRGTESRALSSLFSDMSVELLGGEVAEAFAGTDLAICLLDDRALLHFELVAIECLLELVLDVVLAFLDALGGRFVVVLEGGGDALLHLVRFAGQRALGD